MNARNGAHAGSAGSIMLLMFKRGCATVLSQRNIAMGSMAAQSNTVKVRKSNWFGKIASEGD